jgi:hypothetical protein
MEDALGMLALVSEAQHDQLIAACGERQRADRGLPHGQSKHGRQAYRASMPSDNGELKLCPNRGAVRIQPHFTGSPVQPFAGLFHRYHGFGDMAASVARRDAMLTRPQRPFERRLGAAGPGARAVDGPFDRRRRRRDDPQRQRLEIAPECRINEIRCARGRIDQLQTGRGAL